ncbi:hypothetical protein E2C01_055241 [Portunus trituberculatus]|uniref:Uncharacterized protein n=1 Tax=Portunus trituberculatus TaxID=210409 RepID=A0A5B7GVF2_PORTR|nr:hypothetical protein [Portunus trituberculatus]
MTPTTTIASPSAAKQNKPSPITRVYQRCFLQVDWFASVLSSRVPHSPCLPPRPSLLPSSCTSSCSLIRSEDLTSSVP